MKTIVSFSIIIIFTMRIFSQPEIPAFDKMYGSWEGNYELNGIKFKEYIYSAWVLKHNFFVFQINGEETGNKDNGYEERLIFSLDGNGNITGWSMDYKGYAGIINYTGIVNENKVLLTGTKPNSEFKISFEVKDGQLIQIREIKIDGLDSLKKEVVYSSIRYNYQIYSLPTNYENIGGAGLAYICHLTENFVSVLDTKTNEFIGKINCGNGSDYIRFSKDGTRGYISNYNSGTVTVFDKKTNETIATIDAGENPTDILIYKNNLLISHQSNDGLFIMDRTTNTIKEKKTWGTGFLYMIENENKIYMPQIFSPFLLIIDPEKLEIIKRIKTGGRPMGMAFTQNKRFGYMGNADLNEVTKFDTKTDSIIKHIKNINLVRDMAASPDEKYIYVINTRDNIIYVLSTETDSVITEIKGLSMPVNAGFSPDGKYAYVLNQGIGTISVINTRSHTIIKTIYTAANPITIYFDNGF